MTELMFDPEPSPRYGIEDMVVHDGIREALSTIRSVLGGVGQAQPAHGKGRQGAPAPQSRAGLPSIVIHGPRGSGKTHLLHVAAQLATTQRVGLIAGQASDTAGLSSSGVGPAEGADPPFPTPVLDALSGASLLRELVTRMDDLEHLVDEAFEGRCEPIQQSRPACGTDLVGQTFEPVIPADWKVRPTICPCIAVDDVDLLTGWGGLPARHCGRQDACPASPVLDGDPGVPGPAQDLWTLWNKLTRWGAPMLLSSTAAPSALFPDNPHLQSRVAACVAVQIHPPEDDARLRILDKMGRDRQLRLSADVWYYLATHKSRNLTELGRVLGLLDHISLERSKRITVNLIRSVEKEGLL